MEPGATPPVVLLHAHSAGEVNLSERTAVADSSGGFRPPGCHWKAAAPSAAGHPASGQIHDERSSAENSRPGGSGGRDRRFPGLPGSRPHRRPRRVRPTTSNRPATPKADGSSRNPHRSPWPNAARAAVRGGETHGHVKLRNYLLRGLGQGQAGRGEEESGNETGRQETQETARFHKSDKPRGSQDHAPHSSGNVRGARTSLFNRALHPKECRRPSPR